jgi:hypothetical protein
MKLAPYLDTFETVASTVLMIAYDGGNNTGIEHLKDNNASIECTFRDFIASVQHTEIG